MVIFVGVCQVTLVRIARRTLTSAHHIHVSMGEAVPILLMVTDVTAEMVLPATTVICQ